MAGASPCSLSPWLPLLARLPLSLAVSPRPPRLAGAASCPAAPHAGDHPPRAPPAAKLPRAPPSRDPRASPRSSVDLAGAAAPLLPMPSASSLATPAPSSSPPVLLLAASPPVVASRRRLPLLQRRRPHRRRALLPPPCTASCGLRCPRLLLAADCLQPAGPACPACPRPGRSPSPKPSCFSLCVLLLLLSAAPPCVLPCPFASPSLCLAHVKTEESRLQPRQMNDYIIYSTTCTTISSTSTTSSTSRRRTCPKILVAIPGN
ncbi:hypothetical protein BRADI_4g39565v3 [Brachypodium distachyon]|uniref:Uncharacterized protein n=1 Tax=Brachypodium distachyon TaxID=15368 RepID=A0A0Q3EWA8_BRADI|nr:hypothetical protein BRADI_4g39565v3 [Brachypodium distachyon]PNT65274.1 hypothetical protein BRADI_4g39565v3 [Brachypodium distachyon]